MKNENESTKNCENCDTKQCSRDTDATPGTRGTESSVASMMTPEQVLALYRELLAMNEEKLLAWMNQAFKYPPNHLQNLLPQ